MRLYEAIESVAQTIQSMSKSARNREVLDGLALCEEFADDLEISDKFFLGPDNLRSVKVIFLTKTSLIQIDAERGVICHFLQDFEQVELTIVGGMVDRLSRRLSVNKHKSREGTPIFQWTCRQGGEDYEDFKRLARTLVSLSPLPNP